MPDKWAMDDRRQLTKDANAALDQNLVEGESVRVIIRGVQGSAMIATDSREFIFKKGYMAGVLFGSKMGSFDYKNLSGVHVEAGLFNGYVALQGPGLGSGDLSFWGKGDKDPWKIPHALAINEKDQARERAAMLRSIIAAAQQAPPVAQAVGGADIPDQIRKLGELRDAGILTEDEFQQKKVDLLQRL